MFSKYRQSAIEGRDRPPILRQASHRKPSKSTALNFNNVSEENKTISRPTAGCGNEVSLELLRFGWQVVATVNGDGSIFAIFCGVMKTMVSTSPSKIVSECPWRAVFWTVLSIKHSSASIFHVRLFCICGICTSR